jgi:ATP-binding cassette, subfamily B, bacterial PglK
VIDTIKKLLTFLDKRSRIQLYLLLIPALITAILEIASIGMILPLIPVLLGETTSPNKVLEWLPHSFSDTNPESALITIMAIFAGLFILKNIAILGMVYVINRFSARKLALFSQRSLRHYLNLPYEFHLKRNSSEILYNLTQGGPVAFDGLRIILTIILESILILTTGLLLLLVEPEIVLGIAVFLLAIGGLFYCVMAPIIRHWGEKSHALESLAIKTVNQSLGAIKDIKVLNCYSYLLDIYKNQTDGMATYHSRSLTAQNLPRLIVESVVIIGFGIVVLILLEARGSVTEVVAVLGLFGMAALRLMPSMNRILGSATELKHRASRISALFNDLNLEYAFDSSKSINISNLDLPFDLSIELKNLFFQYEGTSQIALSNINFSIFKGESVGIVGPSGSGKSTMVDIIMGLFLPTSGQLLIDGNDASRNLGTWQAHIGYVSQQIYLTDDSLRRNIAFGIEDIEIDNSQILKVLKLANLHELVEELPEGLETIVGERGIRLSGGQRQRIGIARALYRNPEILIFDEATSALDNETEKEVSEAIESLANEKTIVVIAHRLSTVKKCARLVLMDKGTISDIGDFTSLMESSARFQHMVNLGKLES